jgi:hypothetical protein
MRQSKVKTTGLVLAVLAVVLSVMVVVTPQPAGAASKRVTAKALTAEADAGIAALQAGAPVTQAVKDQAQTALQEALALPGNTPTCQQATDAASAPVVATQGQPPVEVAKPKTVKCDTAGGTRLSVSFGWYMYLHFTGSDVDVVLWNDVLLGAAVTMGIVCAALGFENPVAGVGCATLEAWYGGWLPGIFQTAHNRQNGGVVFECLYEAWLPVGYYYSGNGQ